MTTETCPHCSTDFAYEVTRPDGTTWTGSRCIGVEISSVYDGVLYWQCPDCGGMWSAWPKDHPRHFAAERCMAEAQRPRGSTGSM